MDLCVFFLVTFICITSSPSASQEVIMIDKESREFKKELGMTSSETNALALFNEEKSALEVLDILLKSNMTVKTLFSLSDWNDIEKISNLPGLNDYIKGKVNTFHQLDLPIAFKLLAKVGQLLRVAYAGCKSFECSKVVINVLSKYQDLVRHSSTLSTHFVHVCMRSLKFHRYSHFYLTKKGALEKALIQFKRTIPLAMDMKKESEAVIEQTRELRKMSKNASYQAIDDSKGPQSQKSQFKNKIASYERLRDSLVVDSKRVKKQAQDISKLAIEMKEEEDKVVTMRELEEKKSVLSLQCHKVNRDKFREVCRTVSSWWGWRRTRTCRYVRGQISEMICRKKIDALLVQMRRERLRELSKRLQTFRNKRIEYEQGKLAVLSHYRVLFAELSKTAAELETFKDMSRVRENILNFAIMSLDLAMKSMIIVQTQLIKMIDFWDGIRLHTDELAQRASDKTTDGMLDDTFKEKLFESGFSWLALAKVLSIAGIEMRNTVNAVDKAFTTLPTTESIKYVLNVEGKKIIAETVALSKKHDKARRDTIAKIKILKQKKKIVSERLNHLDEEEIHDEDELDEKYNIMKN